MKPNERLELIDSLLDGQIAEADFLRLEAELHVNPEARQAYYERIELDTLLASTKSTPAPQLSLKPRLIAPLYALAATIALGAFFFWNSSPSTPPTNASGFAILLDQHDATWSDSSLQSGDLIPTGPLALTSGLAQIELFSGVTLLIDSTESPSEFELFSPMEMRVTSGTLRAKVPPPAQGFRIHTADGEIVDLGTEFALNVTEDKTELHVLDGEVEWHPENQSIHPLSKGEALTWSPTSTPAEIEAQPTRFPSATTIIDRRASRRTEWEANLPNITQHPSLLLHWPMANQENWNRTLTSQFSSLNSPLGHISIANRTTGRWDKSALDFSPTGARVRTHIPGEFQSLTLSAWVTIRSLDRDWNSLFLTDSYEPGEPHWQILRDGSLFFSVRPSEEGKGHTPVLSPPIWTPSQSGTWLHLVTTYDNATGLTHHYRNGELIHQERLQENRRPTTITIGDATLGNWTSPSRTDPDFAIRNLNGIIDEFAIYTTPLTNEEITILYQSGRP